MKKSGISRLERLVRETVEGSFGRLLGGHLEPMDVATQLVGVMEDSTSTPELANAYVVALHPADYGLLLEQNSDLGDDLAEAAWKLGRRYGLSLSSRPKISVVQSDKVRRHSFQIAIREEEAEQPGISTTPVVGLQASGDQAIASLRMLDAFLILQG